jgi:hypothetical protein
MFHTKNSWQKTCFSISQNSVFHKDFLKLCFHQKIHSYLLLLTLIRFFSELFSFPVNISFHHRSPNPHHLRNANVSRHPRLGTRSTPSSGGGGKHITTDLLAVAVTTPASFQLLGPATLYSLELLSRFCLCASIP